MNGTDLLAEFRKTRSESAFSELVRRYTNLVYSVAKRRLSNVSLAQEVAQNVFIRLAKTAPSIRSDAELVAWLHRTTINASIDLWRSENRRRVREEQAVVMQINETEVAVWNQLAPILDETLNELNDGERQAILLKFFEQKTMREIGAAFGISEDAAKMRVSRATDRLRKLAGRRGAACGSVALAALLTEFAVEAAPREVVAALAGLRVPSAGIGAGIALSALFGAARAKLAAGLAAALLLAGGTVFLVHSNQAHKLASSMDPAQNVASGQILSSPGEATGPAGGKSNDALDGEQKPDPVKLLQGVLRARQHIASGEMEMEMATWEIDESPQNTNLVRLTALFDDSRLRFESTAVEYSYVPTDPDELQTVQARIKAEKLDHKAAEQAGLLKPFESRHVTACDGAQLLDYWENNGEPVQTRVADPGNASSSIFDPRCLGINISPGIRDNLVSCLSPANAGPVQLLGEENVQGVAAWHVRMKRGAQNADFWIETSNPVRVLKHTWNGSTVISKYDQTNAKDPLPIEVNAQVLHGTIGKHTAFLGKRLVRDRTRYDIPIDPACCSLAGLGMKKGTDVIDYTKHHSIGYWDGTGLSENPPSKAEKSEIPPNRAELMAVLETYPGSSAALDAAQWILLNTQDGAEVDKATDVILQQHIRSTNLARLAQGLERLRHRSSRKLLEAMVEQDPDTEIRGNACLTLATVRKQAAQYGKDKQATEEAEALYERVISEFGQAKRNGQALADLAKPELYELRRLIVGKPAPLTEGTDLDGNALRLSDYRGKVVVLTFWGACGGCRPEVRELRKLLEQNYDKAFAVLGVYCDADGTKAKEIAESTEMTWPSFKDDRTGPISTLWNNNSWPSTFVLDGNGVIRFREVRQGELVSAVTGLLSNRPF